ncbi:MAG: velvet protein [Pycnora praestabilis]|nr:MAG: velvet protein [Pycnora praestabilis]
MSNLIAVAHETKSSSTRVTKEGKKLTYQLHVIQQPERARACGSGAKSSADRRPVDPPPIVELRIFDDAMSDITFSYNANFFLFATLEAARPIAQGRVATTPAAFPVLTGMPVAGMAYLDRPSPAGYFIFPDLSVRHEGKYRLSFNLYEEVKEAKDADSESGEGTDNKEKTSKVAGTMVANTHVYWRLEVKSAPFTVFSAKKFPGLAESTALSRIVAEQGCRVRIRRDVRMRRRDHKPSKDWDEYEDETAYARTRATATPEPYQQSSIVSHGRASMDGGERGRSVSNSSLDAHAPYVAELQRRSSMQDLGQSAQTHYQQPYAPAPPPAAPMHNAYTSHLSFGGSAASQYQIPQYAPTSNMSQPQQTYPQTNVGYHQPSSHVRHISTPQGYGYSSTQQHPQQHYGQAHVRHDGVDYNSYSDYRRASVQQPQAYNNQYMGMYGSMDQGYSRTHSVQPSYANIAPPATVPRTPTPGANGHALPPLKTLQPPLVRKIDPVPPTSMPGPLSAPLQSPVYDGTQMKANAFNPYPTPQSAAPESSRSTKRAFGSVFNTASFDQPLVNGMRPSTTSHGQERAAGTIEHDEDEFDAGFDIASMKMRYKRADGTEMSRKIPEAVEIAT